MGVGRGILLIFVGILLFLSLLVGNVLLILSTSIDYGSLSSEVAPTLSSEISAQFPDDAFEELETKCENQSEFIFSQEDIGLSLTIPCERVSEGKEAVINYSVNTLLENIYYDSYDCGFWSCVTEFDYPFVLMSAKAKDYWMNKFYLTLIASLVLAGVSFLLIHKKLNLLLMLGGLILLSGIPLLFLSSFVSSIAPSEFERLALIFVSNTNKILLSILIIGFVLLITGFVVKILKTGENLIDWFKNRKKKAKD